LRDFPKKMLKRNGLPPLPRHFREEAGAHVWRNGKAPLEKMAPRRGRYLWDNSYRRPATWGEPARTIGEGRKISFLRESHFQWGGKYSLKERTRAKTGRELSREQKKRSSTKKSQISYRNRGGGDFEIPIIAEVLGTRGERLSTRREISDSSFLNI